MAREPRSIAIGRNWSAARPGSDQGGHSKSAANRMEGVG